MIHISHPSKTLFGTIELTASKSESNRALIIQAICNEHFKINNLATAQDTIILKNILSEIKNKSTDTFDVGDAGTTMRFLTAYLSTIPETFILTGSQRMKERPIGILVDALRSLGANIEYLENEGFAPLKITGTKLKGGEINMKGNVSSQYISALLLISPELQNGLVINFETELTSKPYIDMTLKMMEEFRVYGQWQQNSISVSKQSYHVKSENNYAYTIEADWSAASYWYAIASLAKEVDLKIKGLYFPSKQGDAIVKDLYTFFGIKTVIENNTVCLSKIPIAEDYLGFDFSDCPDLAQTAAVTASALEIPMLLNGIHTLRIKETDRIKALKNELEKIGTTVEIINDTIEIKPNKLASQTECFHTYNDHRMAMSIACLAMKMDNICIENPDTVKKSYPEFWTDIQKVGFIIK
jgi:3-phosphoshikimate 1-carboxyvinyltransferase